MSVYVPFSNAFALALTRPHRVEVRTQLVAQKCLEARPCFKSPNTTGTAWIENGSPPPSPRPRRTGPQRGRSLSGWKDRIFAQRTEATVMGEDFRTIAKSTDGGSACLMSWEVGSSSGYRLLIRVRKYHETLGPHTFLWQ